MKRLRLGYYGLALICLSLFSYQNLNFFLEFVKYPTTRSGAFKVKMYSVKAYLILITKDVTDIEFPRIILCHADGKGYNLSKIQSLGFKTQVNFLYAKSENASNFSWLGENMTIEETFKHVYAKPLIDSLISNNSFMKLNGTLREPLKWIEVPMVYPEGRCLKLNFTKTSFKETTLILKFEQTSFQGALELSITDPHREYYKPDVFTFTGDKIKLDFREAGKDYVYDFLKVEILHVADLGNVFLTFRIKISETKDKEEDQETKCSSYSSNFTYKTCTLRSLGEVYESKLGCQPPWFSNNYSTVCNRKFTEEEVVKHLGVDVFRHIDLTEFEGCRRPCLRMEIQSRLLRYLNEP